MNLLGKLELRLRFVLGGDGDEVGGATGSLDNLCVVELLPLLIIPLREDGPEGHMNPLSPQLRDQSRVEVAPVGELMLLGF